MDIGLDKHDCLTFECDYCRHHFFLSSKELKELKKLLEDQCES